MSLPLKNRTIVVPFDFSESSLSAVDQALEMTNESSQIHVLHVVEPVTHVVSLDFGATTNPAFEVDRSAHALDALKKALAASKYQRLTLRTSIGNPGIEIVNYAEHVQATLIVMPSHGRTGIGRLLLGSVAERVLRLATCSVLIIKPLK